MGFIIDFLASLAIVMSVIFIGTILSYWLFIQYIRKKEDVTINLKSNEIFLSDKKLISLRDLLFALFSVAAIMYILYEVRIIIIAFMSIL